jgi:DEAD/DEAH box helicase domain-containing protein
MCLTRPRPSRRWPSAPRPVDSDYYTDAITYTKVTVLEEFDRTLQRHDGAEPLARTEDAAAAGFHGEVHVVSRVVGFKKIKFYTGENVGSGELDLPEQEMHTTAYWLQLSRVFVDSLPFAGDDRREGTVGLGFALRQVAQLLLMCDRHDIGLAIHGEDLRPASTPASAAALTTEEEEPTIFLYDNYPGCIGFREPLFALHGRLLTDTRWLIERCPCETGCPSCVGSVG